MRLQPARLDLVKHLDLLLKEVVEKDNLVFELQPAAPAMNEVEQFRGHKRDLAMFKVADWVP